MEKLLESVLKASAQELTTFRSSCEKQTTEMVEHKQVGLAGECGAWLGRVRE